MKETKNAEKVVIDTNILLDNPEILLSPDIHPIIPYTVLSELDNLKRNPDLKRATQSAIKLIYQGMKSKHIEIPGVPTSISTNDEKIIKSAKKLNTRVLTNDIGARAVAMARNVEIMEDFEDDSIDYEYTGIITIPGDLNYEKSFVQIKEMQLDEFNLNFNVDLKHNQYCIVDRVVEKNDIWVRNKDLVYRISQSMKPFRDAGVVDGPLDSEQMCALHAVINPDVPLVMISGKLGTGKSMLSLMGSLACTRGQKRYKYYDKIFVTRPPISVNRNLQLGFLPGDLSEKLGDWIGGIRSNLKYLLEKTDLQKKEKFSEEVFNEYFEMINIDSMQGVSLHNTILIVDEFQLLDVETLKLVLSRISEGSKVILVGDYEDQTYGINRGNEGWKVILKHLGTSEDMSFVKLKNIYRSKLARFVDKIFN